MESLRVRNPERLCSILEVFSWLDGIRWEEVRNYNLINYCSDDLSAHEKLLTHWLCYIADRQMAFERVWEVGGYVISHLVRMYTRKHAPAREVLDNYVVKDGGSIRLECPLEGANDRLGLYGIDHGPVRFASRYAPEDIVLIYRTFALLERFAHRNLAEFLSTHIAREPRKGVVYPESLDKMARGLEWLTYSAGGACSIMAFDTRLKKEEANVKNECLSNIKGTFHNRFQRKRLWCSLRDYLKSPDFNEVFVDSLTEAGVSDAKAWRRTCSGLKDAFSVIELPGDVWNNSEVFRQGLFDPYIKIGKKSIKMPQVVRDIFEQVKGSVAHFHPEQLDVTFDFVPRMCERNMCDVCPFGGGIHDVCHEQAERYCSVALVSCGYRHKCDPSMCYMKEDSVKGFCKSQKIK